MAEYVATMPSAGKGDDEVTFLRDFVDAVARRQLYEPTMYDTYRWLIPTRENFYQPTEGQRRDEHLFESGTQAAAINFANRIQSIMLPQFRNWAGLSPGTKFLSMPYEARLQAQIQTETVTQLMFAHLHQSNFDSEVTPSLLDLGVGTGALLLQPGSLETNIFQFQSVPQAELFLQEGPYGSVGTKFRRYKMAARNIKPTWDDAELPEKLTKIIDATPNQQIELIEGIRYQPHLDEKRPYCYYVLEPTEKKFIVKRRYRTDPLIVFRWMRMPGEVYGRGPFMTALADVKVMNKVLEYILQNAAMAIAGVYMVQSGTVMNPKKLKFQPGMMIPVLPTGGNHKPIERVDNNGNFDVGQMIVKDMREAVNNHLFNNPLGSINDPVRSATEISYRQQEFADRIGSSFGRLHFELIQPLVARMLDIMDQLGVIDLGGLKVNGQELKVSVESPIAEAQNMEEAMRIDRFMKTILGTAGMQGLTLGTKLEDYPEIMAELFKVTPRLVRPKSERDQMQQDLAAGMMAGGAPGQPGGGGIDPAALTKVATAGVGS